MSKIVIFISLQFFNALKDTHIFLKYASALCKKQGVMLPDQQTLKGNGIYEDKHY